MNKMLMTLILTLISVSSFSDDSGIHTGTRFWLQGYEDVILLKEKLKFEDKKVILEEIITEEGVLGTDTLFIVCAEFEYNDSFRMVRSQAYWGKIPKLFNRISAPRSNIERGCDIDGPEYDGRIF